MIRFQYTFLILICPYLLVAGINAQENILAKVVVAETSGLAREMEYVEISLQAAFPGSEEPEWGISAVDESAGETMFCQAARERDLPRKRLSLLRIIFPVSIPANTVRTFILKTGQPGSRPESDLRMAGEGLELKIDNEFYRADLTKRLQPEPKIHASGQLQELLIKMGFNQLLTNEEDRIHWAPNFKRQELQWYTTIAHWENPREYFITSGNYLIQTLRRDLAPDHPEIMLTAVYKFYSGVPYFKFYSEMEFIRDLPLELLRNDEMTMDSMFTHLAFQRPDGEIIDVGFAERHQVLRRQPIEDDALWVCFYNLDRGFAYGSIRLRYDNSNKFGEPSPTYLPHTQIGEWMGRKYWNRRLIHDRLSFVPRGSRYIEENAYLVFRLGKTNRFETIQYWAKRLRHPLRVAVYPLEMN